MIGYLFLDRSPRLFQSVLDILQQSKREEDEMTEDVQEELKFYGISMTEKMPVAADAYDMEETDEGDVIRQRHKRVARCIQIAQDEIDKIDADISK